MFCSDSAEVNREIISCIAYGWNIPCIFVKEYTRKQFKLLRMSIYL
jgi:hypothetical protein